MFSTWMDHPCTINEVVVSLQSQLCKTLVSPSLPHPRLHRDLGFTTTSASTRKISSRVNYPLMLLLVFVKCLQGQVSS
jgi:hypothetical protein